MARRHVAFDKRAFAKSQRSVMTRAETMLWQELRAGRFDAWKFRRQVPLGAYIADFVCFEARLIVELDGEPHETAERRAYDASRDAWLTGEGFLVLRFANEAVLGNAGHVLDRIAMALAASRGFAAPSPGPR